MLEYLEQPRGILLGNDARTIGGSARVTAALLQRCCEIMQTYVVLAVQTMHAEFPDFDLMQAFGIFNLRPVRKGDNLDHVVWTDRKQKDLERLSAYAGQDPARVRSQFCDLEPAARYEQSQTGCSSFEAWKVVALRFQSGRKALRQRHPTDAIVPVLIKYGAHSGATTSGVEQSFSLLQRYQPAERKHMLDGTALDEACLMLLPNDTVLHAQLCDRAVQIWADHLGAPRERCKARVDKGIPKGPKVAGPGEPMTETAFIKKRRMDVAGSATSATASEALEAARLSSYSDGQAKILAEEAFQCSKGYTNKVQAYLSKTLLESEIDEDLREAATVARLHQEGLDKERTRKEDRLAEKLRPKHINVQARHFHLQDDAWIAYPEISRRNCVADLVDAQAFVVRDPGNPPDRTLWACMLLGGVLCDLEYCRSLGQSGICFLWESAVKVQRSVFLSEGFRQEEAGLFSVIRDIAALPQSKWRVTRDLEEFVTRTITNRAKKRRYQAIGLFASREEGNLAGEENMFTKSGFVKFAAKLALVSNGTKCGSC